MFYGRGGRSVARVRHRCGSRKLNLKQVRTGSLKAQDGDCGCVVRDCIKKWHSLTESNLLYLREEI
jgi:hypothetical protein